MALRQTRSAALCLIIPGANVTNPDQDAVRQRQPILQRSNPVGDLDKADANGVWQRQCGVLEGSNDRHRARADPI